VRHHGTGVTMVLVLHEQMHDDVRRNDFHIFLSTIAAEPKMGAHIEGYPTATAVLHSFTQGSKPTFSTNPSHVRLLLPTGLLS